MATKDDWSAAQYLKFKTERTRAARDLLARVPLTAPRGVVDLGCGPGNSTAILAEKFQQAKVSGVDSSPDMIAQARQSLPKVSFAVGDLEQYEPEEKSKVPIDLLFSNAVFQWLPGPRRLDIIAGLVRRCLSPGGVLAFQVPNNLSEPCHAVMRELAAQPNAPWSDSLGAALPDRGEFPTPAEIYDALRPQCSVIDIWKTTYYHEMADHAAIVEWLKGTGLRPFLGPLSEPEREAFLEAYLQRLKELYPAQADGKILLPYPRLFVVADKADFMHR